MQMCIFYGRCYANVYFVVHIYEAYRNEQYKYFESATFTNHLYFALGENIQSYKPLIKHGTALKFVFTLHHHLSVKM